MGKINTAKDDGNGDGDGYDDVDLNYPRFAMWKGCGKKISAYLQALAWNLSPSPNGPEQTLSCLLSPSPFVCASVPLCVRLCTTVRVCVHVIEPTDMQVVAVVIDTWAAPIEANSCLSSDALRLRALWISYTLHANVGATMHGASRSRLEIRNTPIGLRTVRS